MPSPVAIGAVTIEAVTADRLPDLATLFGSNKTTTGCYCMWFLVPAKECSAGWNGGNRVAFEEATGAAAEPMGLLAYRDDEPIGWCAAGPRTRYARALRSPVLAGRDVDADARVWLVPCFYVRRDVRRSGVTRALLEAAVALARTHRATAIEGFPLAGEKRRGTGDAFVGVEPLFATCGFTVIDRPTPSRVVMRRELSRRGPARRRQSGQVPSEE
jgi:GNAT superfamily N-acetyltransferase